MNKVKIAVIGLCGVSTFMKTPSFPKPGETITSSHVFHEIGGKGFNQALAAKRLGADVIFMTALGNDDQAKSVMRQIHHEKMKTTIRYKKAPTAQATILTNDEGENMVVVHSGACAFLNEEDVDVFEEAIVSSDCLILQQEVPMSVNQRAMEIAKNYGVKVIVNPAPLSTIDMSLLKQAWVITPNEKEAKTLFHEFDVQQINQDIKRVVITMGKKGAVLIENNAMKSYDALPVNCIDSTGAGDVFTAALAYKIALNESLEDAIRFALVASGISVTKSGIINSFPTMQQIIDFNQ